MIVAEAREMLIAVCGPRSWSDTRPSWLARGARALGWDYARTSNIFYGRARVIRAEEWIALKEISERLEKSAVERRGRLNEIAIGIAKRDSARTG